MIRLRLSLAILLTCWASLGAAQDLTALISELPNGDFDDRALVVEQIARTGDERAAPVLDALLKGDLHVLKSNESVVILRKVNKETHASDPITGSDFGEVPRRGSSKISVNNNLRSVLRASIGILTLSSPDPSKRLRAATAAFGSPDPEQLDLLSDALSRETDPDVEDALERAVAATTLQGDRPLNEKLVAVDILRKLGNQDAARLLSPLLQSEDSELADAAAAAIRGIEQSKKIWAGVQNIWFGLSLGSVLLLAAIGLAITFGVMGVINMAHGELVMLGAYTTYAVQEVIRTSFPGAFEWSLLIAAPLAFLVAGGVGVAIERGCVRFLYGRPLETLLATWGVSLMLQQTVRSIFGPNNREVGNPDWMSGAFELGQMTVTYNRVWILLFSLAVFATLLFVMKKTPIGLQMRAVTQNRAMAANMGIRTGWVDAMTFGLGAGIAGLAGVALSQIDNVSPNLGQSYIVDSFMVVVFGGAGNIWGTLAGAFSIGIANKFLEPWTGAVLAKIVVLVCIILFIQKRPRGLFAVRGRAVEG